MPARELKILNAESEDYCLEAETILRSLGSVTQGNYLQDSILPALKSVNVLVVRLGISVDRALMEAAPELKVVVSATTGTDHIDLETAKSRNIAVLTLKHEYEFLDTIPSTAEHTWALLLSLVRKIPQAARHVLAGGWDRQKFRGNNLMGKRLGILGVGRVGCQVARMGLAFRMQVLGYDNQPSIQVPPGVRMLPDMNSLISNSDVLSIHVPLNKENEQLVDAVALQHLPVGAVVINTSRGGIWDEKAVVKLLDEGRIAGVATDVISGERSQSYRKTNPLLKYASQHDNVLITPHIAGATRESMAMTEVFMARKLEDFINNNRSLFK